MKLTNSQLITLNKGKIMVKEKEDTNAEEKKVAEQSQVRGPWRHSGVRSHREPMLQLLDSEAELYGDCLLWWPCYKTGP